MKKLFLLIALFTLYTHHSNSQWIQQPIPVSKPITGIKFLNTQTGWACTSYGTQQDTSYILHTTNGGTNWSVQFQKSNAAFLCLFMINVNTGYVGGAQFDSGNTTVIYKTTNSGLNWITILPGVSLGVYDMFFVNADSGYMSSELFTNVYSTTNGGLNWTLRTNGINTNVYRLFFLNYNTGYCGASTNLYKTTNAGMNWVLHGAFGETVYAVNFFNEQTGYLGLSGHRIAKTTNAGINWNVQYLFDPRSETITDIFFINNNTGFACTGWMQRILKTTDAGVNWGYQVIPSFSSSLRASVLDSFNVWVSTVNQGVFRTTNGGGNITYSGIEQTGNEIPNSYKLYQNYPNPFNPVTVIKVDISRSSQVKFIISDILGKEIYRENKYLKAGSYEFKWDAAEYPSGIYFYRLITDKFSETKKMILIK